ncbi:hypothetical protein DIT71_15985 [Marinobacter vulgaris]|uniref:Integrase n=1 Tax=Marinobacter vulgaris TaxID=1928331 RepID=A0A2V3ZGJ6_9GAMM|nr:integrase arm-type DNA-binding domain-containing protein [Marinobacter vulgaris]PXX89076.1 hypothetical protein DIT71_15985 [Marinobacter vulgaris]TSJ67483.1 DUF4102 domain-containing protein [Marinobacter vulgaris]
MPKKVPEMGPAQVRNLRHGVVKEGGKKRIAGELCVAYHRVGGVDGLALQCRPPTAGQEIGSRSWVLITTVGLRRREIGLGGYPDVSLGEARELARQKKEQIRNGIDPVEQNQERKAREIERQRKKITFGELAEEYYKIKEVTFRGKKPQRQRNRLRKAIDRCMVEIGDTQIGDLTVEDVVRVLSPLWTIKTPTATRIRQTIAQIWKMADSRNLVSGKNPADWNDNLDGWLAPAKRIHKTKHKPAMRHQELPDFMKLLLKRDTVFARALEFQILTVARPTEVQFAEWSEINFEEGVWTLPGDKVKNRDPNEAHTVPLVPRAIEILRSMPKSGRYVFPGYGENEQISENALNNTVKAIHRASLKSGGKGFVDPRYNLIACAHGMRSCFKNFSASKTEFDV